MSEITFEWESVEKQRIDWITQLRRSAALNKLPEKIRSDLNYASLRFFDNFIRENFPQITCADIRSLYWKFWLDLKKTKMNSTNFVGFSEFLIIRSFVYYLSDCFSSGMNNFDSAPIPLTKGDLGYLSFKNKNTEVFMTTECIPKSFKDLGSHRPDIIIYRNNPEPELLAVVQIKAAPCSKAYAEADLRFLDVVTEQYPDAKTLLIIYFGCKKLFDEKGRVCKLEENGDKQIAQVFNEHISFKGLIT